MDLAWFVLGYRRLEQDVRERAHKLAQPELCDALSELFLWDMGLVLSAYQRSLDHDDATQVLRHRAFWNRASFDAQFRLQRNQGAVVVVIQLDGLEALRRGTSPPDSHGLLEQIGRLLAGYRSARTLVGRLGGDEFGLWTDRIDDVDLVRLMRHIPTALRRLAPTIGAFFTTAALGPQGTTLEALCTHAYSRDRPYPKRLAQHRQVETAGVFRRMVERLPGRHRLGVVIGIEPRVAVRKGHHLGG